MSYETKVHNPVNTESEDSRANRWRHYYYLLAIAVFGLDQLTKHLVATRLALNTGWIDVIPSFFAITHVQNRGAAFSLFADGTSSWRLGMLIVFSFVAMIGISIYLWRGRHAYASTGIALGLILGGAVGNLWDRLLHGRVTDFLHVYVRDWSWPDFNVADSAIVIGAMLLIAEVMFTSPKSAEKKRTAQS